MKCPVPDTEMSAPECRARVADGDRDRPAAHRRRDGRGLAGRAERRSSCRWRGRSTATTGEAQKLTPTIDALYVPDIDAALDEEGAKREFWGAFRVLGDWYAELPPY